MSQSKVDQYKKEKAGRKASLKRKKLAKILWSVGAIILVIGICLGVYFSTRPTFEDASTNPSKFDDVALASVLGYDGVPISEVPLNGDIEVADAE